MIEEPRVKVTTIDYSELAARMPDALNCGLVVNSDTGPVDITRIDNQGEFLKKYFTTNQLNPTDDVTMKHAYKLLQFMPIYITRAMDNSVFGGITANGDVIYTDTDFQVMKYYKKLSFTEKANTYDFVFMSVKASSASTDKTAKCFFIGDFDKVKIATIEDLTDLAIKAEDVIYDTVTEKYYSVVSNSNGIIMVEDTDSTEEKFKYAFNVKRGTKCQTPAQTDLFKIGSFVKVGDSNYYVTSDTATEWTECINLPSTPNLLNLLTGYNSSSASLSKFYSIEDDGEKLNVTISYETKVLRVGYKLNSGELTDLDLDSLLESSKYKQFSGTAQDQLAAGEYLSINGFTYFSEDNSSTNNTYPYVTVNVSAGSNCSVNKFLTYIYDYQLVNDTNIEPALLSSKLVADIAASKNVKIECEGDFKNAFIITRDDNEKVLRMELLSNNKVTQGCIKIEVAGVKSIIHRGYETNGVEVNPYPDYAEIPELYDVNGMNTVHSTGKALYMLLEFLGITIVEDSEYETKILYPNDLLESTSNNVSAISGPNDATNNFKYSFFDDASVIGNISYSGMQLIIDDYLFYNVSYSTKNPDLTPVRISSAPLTFMQFIKTLRRYVGNYFNMINSENGFTLMTDDPDEYHTITFKKDTTGSIEMDEVQSTNNAGIVDSAKFALINKCPSKKKMLQFSLTQDSEDPELYTLVITRKTDEVSYTISFVEDKVDGYGRNVYYTYVNEMNEYIHLVELNGASPIIKGTYTSALFGNEVPIAEPEVDDYIASMNRFKENRGIYYDFLFDAGYSHLAYAKGIFEVCKEIYAEGLLTMPQITDPKQLINYRDTCGIDTSEGWRCVMRGNWINDTTVSDFLIRMSPMCAYLEKIVNNKVGMKEFAPVFGATNGSITYEAGFYINKKSTREELLTSQIPIVIEDKSLGLRYFNLDTTLKVVDSSLAEANNCRMINCAAHIADNQMKWYIGRFNTPELRREVTNALTNLINQRLVFNQVYPLYGFRVICNDSNNPVEVVENRELVVDIAFKFLPGIRYINVFNKVYKLSQDLNAL